jgi:hypothetical protein
MYKFELQQGLSEIKKIENMFRRVRSGSVTNEEFESITHEDRDRNVLSRCIKSSWKHRNHHWKQTQPVGTRTEYFPHSNQKHHNSFNASGPFYMSNARLCSFSLTSVEKILDFPGFSYSLSCTYTRIPVQMRSKYSINLVHNISYSISKYGNKECLHYFGR